MRRVSVSVVGFALATSLSASAKEAQVPFKVIVNPRVTGRTLARDALAQIYLGKADRWSNGGLIVAVDLSSTSAVREAFSAGVLGMSVEAVKHYWLRRISAGRWPPVTKSSDEDVIAFVAAEPGGVGYVSAETPVPATVREVALE